VRPVVDSIVITGRAYQRRATLEIAGDTLVWRARRGQLTVVAENIATTTHDVKAVRYVERRYSFAGIAIAGLAVMWMLSESVAVGGGGLAVGLALMVHRALRPRRWLGLDLGEHWLVLKIDAGSADRARALAQRIDRQLISGEVPTSPPALP
jgi:hypothetical protein